MKAFLILALVTICVSAGPKHYELEGYTFEKYLFDFEKSYPEESEFMMRKTLFEQNLAIVFRHNADETQTWKMGVNKFTDQTTEEFKQVLGHKKGFGNHQQASRFLEEKWASKEELKDLPAVWDWRSHAGVVTPVKDQGACGSCWAFATTETIESHAAIRSNITTILSPQQVVSCVKNPYDCGGTGGCSGATAEVGTHYVQLYGQTTEDQYPYKAKTGTCEYDPSTAAVTVMGYLKLEANNQEVLQRILVEEGPVAISVDASKWSFYESGIFAGCDYTENIDLDHAVQCVGWDDDGFIVRNSWGENWGENGYIRLKKDDVAQCGTDSTPADGSACKNDGQKTQKACGMCGMLSDSVIPLGADIVKI